MDKLKLCPFCGGKAFLAHGAKRKIYGKDEYRTGTAVYCGVCEARMFYANPKLAVEAWNRLRAKAALGDDLKCIVKRKYVVEDWTGYDDPR